MEAINFTDEALDNLAHWKKSGNVIVLKRIRQLLQAIQADPFNGIVNPKHLNIIFRICGLAALIRNIA